MGIKLWNVWRRGGANARVGDTVRYRDEQYEVVGIKGSDSHGVPYVRLVPVGTPDDGSRETVCLVTEVERLS
ncbi:MAG: hypothetical protein PVF43_01420 [Candidatus Eiseniibacteriota bacterium]|jgi:hypothetical protein